MIDLTLMTHNKRVFARVEKRPFFKVLNHGIVCNVIIVCTVQQFAVESMHSLEAY